jgi:hypothetical protein
MPYIHKLNKSFGSSRCITRPLGKINPTARNHKRVLGSGLKDEVYEEGRLHKATDTLRNLKLSKPRLPKKYITFD